MMRWRSTIDCCSWRALSRLVTYGNVQVVHAVNKFVHAVNDMA
jgi:hypothetical protein